jgi:hypothetical protein
MPQFTFPSNQKPLKILDAKQGAYVALQVLDASTLFFDTALETLNLGGIGNAVNPTVLLKNVPAAGVDPSVTVGAGTFQLVAILARLTTGAAVANRNIDLQILDAQGNQIFRSQVRFSETATQDVIYNWGAGLPNDTALPASGEVLLSLPPNLILSAGAVVKIATSNLQVADQWAVFSVILNPTIPLLSENQEGFQLRAGNGIFTTWWKGEMWGRSDTNNGVIQAQVLFQVSKKGGGDCGGDCGCGGGAALEPELVEDI